MAEFTSGKRAQLGLQPANHDPYPWVWVASKSGMDSGRCSVTVPDDVGDGYHGELRPRPEFAVLDNPILAAFREQGPGFFGGIDGWLKYATHGTHCNGVPIPDGAIDHARRILTLLANLTKEN